MIEAGWSRQFARETDPWLLIRLSLSGGDPLRARELRECTESELAIAWQDNRRQIEGVGYKIRGR